MSLLNSTATSILSDNDTVQKGAFGYAALGALCPVLMPITWVWVVPITIIVMLILVLVLGFSWSWGVTLGYVATIPVTFYFLYTGTMAFAKVAPLLLI
jgi:hypothetical protein